ncbi:hypothetical protein Y032_0344g3079 [Ancylostoma ceylanicum]|uniref:Tyrosine-protein phosphatase domain-containing protein n=1 Tax=Ancylostoma ceylanicum TaxID=53326 RepID=A0A016RXQ8_9BILA|nr:hypothetical protein Y032_0344g3079 [Ancylostoma ceylanicum]
MFLLRRVLNMPGGTGQSLRNRQETQTSEEKAKIKLLRKKKKKNEEDGSKERRTSTEECRTAMKDEDPSTRSAIPVQEGTADQDTKQQARKAKRAQVKIFVEATLRKGVNGLIAEFKSMKRSNDFTVMTEFVAQNANGRNRYKDVGCLDNRRVVVNIGSVSYIHANYVSTPNNSKRFICTQTAAILLEEYSGFGRRGDTGRCVYRSVYTLSRGDGVMATATT